jgi:xanthine dehydrogenase accessory factor
LSEEQPAITGLEFEATEAAREGMLCGGRISLFTEIIFPSRQERGIFQVVVDELKASRPVAMATAVVTAYPEKPPGGPRVVFRREKILAGSLADPHWNEKVIAAASGMLEREEPLYLSLESKLEAFPELEGFLVEAFHAEPTLVIFGAGHVAQPLCNIAAMAGFRVVVVDNRAEFASRERFPDSSEILLCEPEEAFTRLDPGPGHYLVSVTRGHLEDRKVIEHALRFPAAYIGMIGSKRKVKLLWEELKARGVEPDALERVHAPIGLEIGAETPAEIAVSILAEMIQTRRAAGKPVIRRETIQL